MSIKTLDSKGLKEKLDKGENIILVDCREQDEWDDGHIEQASLMPLSNFESEAEKLTDKNAEIILQCRSGKRSLQAATYLEEQGFSNLTNLEGGILGWIEQGLPTK